MWKPSRARTPSVARLNSRAISSPETLPRAGSSIWTKSAPAATSAFSSALITSANPAVGDDVHARLFHVADGGVRGVVHHLLEVTGPGLAGLVGLHGHEPPAGMAVGADDGGGNQGKIARLGHSKSPPSLRPYYCT